MIKNRHSLASEQIDTLGGDVTTGALPEGALARFGRGSVRDTAFSPDGQYFAVASAIGLWLYELPTLSPIALWDTERGMTDDVIFSPDSRRVVTSTFVENVKIWEVHSGTCIAEISLDDREICRPVFFARWTISCFCELPHQKQEDLRLGLTHGVESQGNRNTTPL